MVSSIKDLREETNDLISDLNVDILTLEKEVNSLNVELDNINQCKHGNALVISGNIIPQGSPTENCKDILLNLF